MQINLNGGFDLLLLVLLLLILPLLFILLLFILYLRLLILSLSLSHCLPFSFYLMDWRCFYIFSVFFCLCERRHLANVRPFLNIRSLDETSFSHPPWAV